MKRAPAVGGFTLLELLVALALTGIVALLVQAIFGGILAARTQVARARRDADLMMNGRHWLEAAAGSIDVRRAGFFGGTDSMEFTAWMPGPGGWMAPARVVLARGSRALELRTPDRILPIAAPVDAVQFDYLADLGLDAQFLDGWTSPLSAPVAIRVRYRTPGPTPRIDTLLLTVGDRG